jgi:hypothetical protein
VPARVLAIVCLIAAGAATCAEAPPVIVKPVEAELIARLSVRGLKEGDTIYARVARDWSGSGCHLRRGATLEGTVHLATPHFQKSRSALAIGFERAECGDAGLQTFRLVLEALAGPAEDGQEESSGDLPAPSAGMPQTIVPHPAAQRADPPVTLKPGEVRGLKKLHLSVAAGPERSSVLVQTDSDVLLEAHTLLLLRPFAEVPPGTSAAVVFLQPPPVMLLPAEDSISESSQLAGCAPQDCAASSFEGDEERAYSGSIPLRELGYASRSNREIFAPTQDEALAWLSPTELLVTFNPHLLVPRFASTLPDHAARIIRAVLVDVSSRTIRQTLDWRVCDNRQFLWHLPGARVLVHVGDELRVYGAGMRVEQRVGLAGPLAFVRVSPDGGIVAIGIVRERHTPTLHASLAASLERDPDEDVEVVLMNDRFAILGSALGNSDASAPILLNEGQVKLVLAPGQGGSPNKRYSLQLRTWDDNSRSLGRFQSSCSPEISSLPPDFVFLVTCGKSSGGHEYRVLQADGKPLLHGQSYVRELGHAASGEGSPGTFAVRIFKAGAPMVPGVPFHAADLESAELVIYSCQDGKRLSTVHVKDPAASSGGYAVSPAGEVAILTRDDVDVYSVRHK